MIGCSDQKHHKKKEINKNINKATNIKNFRNSNYKYSDFYNVRETYINESKKPTIKKYSFPKASRFVYLDAILVYTINDKNSYEQLKEYWYFHVKESVLFVICANKSDLINEEQIDEGKARNYAKEIGHYFSQLLPKMIMVFLIYSYRWPKNI